MNPNMPEENTIEVTADQVRALRTAGPGSLLVWHEPTDRVLLTEPGTIPDENMMIIGGHNLKDLTEAVPPGDVERAAHLNGLAQVWRVEWPIIKLMTPTMVRIRRALATRGIYVNNVPTVRHSKLLKRRWLTDEYTTNEFPRVTVRVMITHDHEELARACPNDALADVQILVGKQLVQRFAIEVDTLSLEVAAEVMAAATHTVLKHTASA